MVGRLLQQSSADHPETARMPPRTRLGTLNCSLAQALDIVGDWWTLLIVRDLFIGASRFGEIQRSLGIARTMLTSRLGQLERAGILQRKGAPRRPLYFLTRKGRDLFPAIVALMQWGDRWAAPNGPPMRLTDGTGRGAAPVVVRTHDGAPISWKNARFAAGPGAAASTRDFIEAMAASKRQAP
jgi:DNA-binding HxlR family transcriptional regulator